MRVILDTPGRNRVTFAVQDNRLPGSRKCLIHSREWYIWLFKASQPKDPDRPKGAYFTDLEPSAENLRVLHKKVRVPREKQEYVFQFKGAEGLMQLNNGTGRDKRIFFSALDYEVVKDRQDFEGGTQTLSEAFT
jgi:hypothetical protein